MQLFYAKGRCNECYSRRHTMFQSPMHATLKNMQLYELEPLLIVSSHDMRDNDDAKLQSHTSPVQQAKEGSPFLRGDPQYTILTGSPKFYDTPLKNTPRSIYFGPLVQIFLKYWWGLSNR